MDDNVDMEEKPAVPLAAAAAAAEVAIVDISDFLIQWLTSRFPQLQIQRQVVTVPANISEVQLMMRCCVVYPSAFPFLSSDAETTKLYNAFKHKLKADAAAKNHDPATEKPDLVMWESAFNAPFVGHAHEQLLEYVKNCWESCAKVVLQVRFPYIALVQSSGFGKSRLLKECAVLCQERNAMARSTGHDDERTRDRFHLLYVCVRNVEESTGFPVETATLHKYLFPSEQERELTFNMVDGLVKKLVRLFEYVIHTEATKVDALLLKLFSQGSSDAQAAQDAVEAQDHLCKALPPPRPTSQRAKQDQTTGRRRVLILAIDEARALLPAAESERVNIGWFRVLRRALREANKLIRVSYGYHSGIFGIVVDTNSKVSDFSPSVKFDPSLRNVKEVVVLPPFVVTDTMDVFFNGGKEIDTTQQAVRYREKVLAAVRTVASRDRSKPFEPSAWMELKKLGRPLWGSPLWTHETITEAAARKLVGGAFLDSTESIKAGHGALASMLCRLGIRPYVSTSLATEVVADHMAVLSYVAWERERLIVSYSSDPILTLGATRLWYTIPKGESENLLTYTILRKLKLVLHQEVLDTGGIGELVARIMLLLAMDACAVLETGDKTMRWMGGGEFYRVSTFFRALEGDQVKVHRRPKERLLEMDVVRRVMHRWRHHYVSFTHFVQLSEEPTEACLWGLLGRRAAGILPRGQKGADFVIPICRPEATPQKRKAPDTNSEAGEELPPVVTMILVQVKNYENGFSSFSKEVTEKLHPTFVFKEGNPLRGIAANDTLRVFVSLREAGTTAHCYLSLEKDATGIATAFALCLRGFGPWSTAPEVATSGAEIDAQTQRDKVVIVSKPVADLLTGFLGPWWSAANAIMLDTEECPARQRVDSPRISQTRAIRSLGESLVLNEPLITSDAKVAGPSASQEAQAAAAGR